MKKHFRSLTVVLVMLCSLTIFASADEADSGISVQLDGQNLVFTDAVPQVKDSRTFLPCRAVFEAMGAEVSNGGNLITAIRGDTTLTMTLGETTAIVTCGEDTKTITMDVAPYVDNTTWRTYVPVRFAADAFGCNVGWDQASMTAIIVDVDKLMDEAMAGKEFTVLEKFMEYSQKYNTGTWSADGSFEGTANMMGAQVLSVNGTMNGIVADSTAGEMTMTTHMDLSGLLDLITTLQSNFPEDMGMAKEDMVLDMSVDVKMDLTTGQMYIKFSDEFNQSMNLPVGAWLSMDFNSLMESAGMEWDLSAMTAMQADTISMLKTFLASVPLDGGSTAGYTQLSDTLNSLVALVSDEGFQKTDVGYETALKLEQDGMIFTVKLALDTDRNGSVTGYSMNADISLPLDEETKSVLTEAGLSTNAITMSMSTGVDKNDVMTAQLNLSFAPVFSLDMDMNVTYKTTDQVPNTAPPEGAEIVDYLELLGLTAP